MKKILLPAFLMLAGAAMSADVATTNLLGISTITSSRANVIVAIPWADYDADPANSGEISVAQIVNLANLQPGDLLYALNDNGTPGQFKYYGWKVNAAGTAWDKLGTVVVTNGAEYTVLVPPAASEQKLTRGKAFWLHRQDPTRGGGTFYLNGQFKSGTVQTAIVPGQANLVASPALTSFDLTSIATNIGSNDVIKVMADNGKVKNLQCIKNAKLGTVWFKNGKRTTDPADLTVAAGQGFWYVAGSDTTSFNIEW